MQVALGDHGRKTLQRDVQRTFDIVSNVIRVIPFAQVNESENVLQLFAYFDDRSTHVDSISFRKMMIRASVV